MFDLVILGGRLVDGTGSPGYMADVGIVGERIEAIGDLKRAETRRVVDATGLVVSPGFIDTHAHSDGVLLVDPQHANGLRQGITTEILGQERAVVCAAVWGQLQGLSPLPGGPSGGAAGGPGHEQRRRFQVSLPQEGGHQHRLLRSPRRGAPGGGRLSGRAADRRPTGQGEEARGRGDGAGRRRLRDGHELLPQLLERH